MEAYEKRPPRPGGSGLPRQRVPDLARLALFVVRRDVYPVSGIYLPHT